MGSNAREGASVKNTNWREIVEIIGIVTIVASLLLVALELRQSNRIASSQLEVEMAQLFNQNMLQRATNAEYARLYAKIVEPEAHLITATEQQQIAGLAWHYVNTFYVAQAAYDNGLLSDEELAVYIHDLEVVIEEFPALVPHFIDIREARDWVGTTPIFRPIMELDVENQ